MRKLKAIWQLLLADEWAVFTYRYAPEHPYITFGDLMTWNIRRYDKEFIQFIKYKATHIINHFEDGYDIDRDLYSEI